MFAVPTYFFIAMMGVLFVVGAYRFATGGLHPVATNLTFAHEELKNVGLFVILHAFASGSTALTGVEAISNGVPAFRRPQAKNAADTLAIMGAIADALNVAHVDMPATPEKIWRAARISFG